MFFVFRVDPSPQHHDLVLFSTLRPDAGDLLEAVQTYCEHNPPPDRVYLIVSRSHSVDAQEAIDSSQFADRMPAISRQLNTPAVEIKCFGVSGFDATPEMAAICQAGLVELCRRHNVMLESTPTHHFVKPSLKHCSAFIRAGNVLVNGPEIEFIAACCLPYVPDGMQRIYCDTGAIHPVAYAILKLLASFNDDRMHSTVSSFGSYRQLHEYRFESAADSLVLISASTSGELPKRLRLVEPRLRSDNIATLFYLGEQPDSESWICNLTHDPVANPDGYSVIQSYPHDACPLCQGKSTAVPMSGDHFLPVGTEVRPLLIRAADAPAGLSRFIQPLVGKQVLRANYQDERSGGNSKDLFVDLERVFDSCDFLGIERWRSKLESVLSHSVSLDICRIVSLDDPGSLRLACRIVKYCRSKGKSDVPIVRASQLQEDVVGGSVEPGATLVVASAMATGRQLLGVAQTLRYTRKCGAINYVVGLARCNSREAFTDIRSHLTYGDSGPGEHGFRTVDMFLVPCVSAISQNAWDKELLLWSGLEFDIPEMAQQRRRLLELADSVDTRGLCCELFLPAISGVQLALRPSFAFWDFDYSGIDVSQGDVFATVCLVLHSLRKEGRDNRSLGQYDHVRRILSPRCFERFNDGVIQAAILRAAYPWELDYSIADDVSDEMHDVLRAVFRQRQTEVGEASMEFLLALATKQLRLSPSYLDALAREFEEGEGDELWRFLWMRIRSEIGDG